MIDMIYKPIQQGAIAETKHISIATDILQKLIDYNNHIQTNGAVPVVIKN